MIMMVNKEFIRDHGLKEAMEASQIEMYIFIIKLLQAELERVNQKDQTSF